MAKRKDASQNANNSRDKFNYIWTNLIGCNVTCYLKDGKEYRGLLQQVGVSRNEGINIKLKYAYEVSKSSRQRPIDNLDIKGSDLVCMNAIDVEFVEDKGSAFAEGFQTDTAISGGNGRLMERELQRWEAGDSADTMVGEDFSLEAEDRKARSWNQFEANESKFGIKTDWDFNRYSSQIKGDKNSAEYREREAYAERKAREIEGRSSSNIHIMEERGTILDDKDEEERYGAVIRDSGGSGRRSKGGRTSTPSPQNGKPKSPNRSNSSPGAANSTNPVNSEDKSKYVPPAKRGTSPSTKGKPSISPRKAKTNDVNVENSDNSNNSNNSNKDHTNNNKSSTNNPSAAPSVIEEDLSKSIKKDTSSVQESEKPSTSENKDSARQGTESGQKETPQPSSIKESSQESSEAGDQKQQEADDKKIKFKPMSIGASSFTPTYQKNAMKPMVGVMPNVYGSHPQVTSLYTENMKKGRLGEEKPSQVSPQWSPGGSMGRPMSYRGGPEDEMMGRGIPIYHNPPAFIPPPAGAPGGQPGVMYMRYVPNPMGSPPSAGFFPVNFPYAQGPYGPTSPPQQHPGVPKQRMYPPTVPMMPGGVGMYPYSGGPPIPVGNMPQQFSQPTDNPDEPMSP